LRGTAGGKPPVAADSSSALRAHKRDTFPEKAEQALEISVAGEETYFCCLGEGVGCGVGAGCVLTGCDFTPCNTEFGPPRRAA
jgi:hypothetical protein